MQVLLEPWPWEGTQNQNQTWLSHMRQSFLTWSYNWEGWWTLRVFNTFVKTKQSLFWSRKVQIGVFCLKLSCSRHPYNSILKLSDLVWLWHLFHANSCNKDEILWSIKTDIVHKDFLAEGNSYLPANCLTMTHKWKGNLNFFQCMLILIVLIINSLGNYWAFLIF